MAKSGGRELVLALILSILLTITLFYSTFEVPRVLDKVLQQYFPEVFWDVEAREEMLGALRPIGYAAFAATIVLIALASSPRRSSCRSRVRWPSTSRPSATSPSRCSS
jgi:hypothetical protein